MKISFIKSRLTSFYNTAEIYVSFFTGKFAREILTGLHQTRPRYRSIILMIQRFVNPREAYSRVSEDAETNLRIEQGTFSWIHFVTIFDKRSYIDYPTTFKLVIFFSRSRRRCRR